VGRLGVRGVRRAQQEAPAVVLHLLRAEAARLQGCYVRVVRGRTRDIKYRMKAGTLCIRC